MVGLCPIHPKGPASSTDHMALAHSPPFQVPKLTRLATESYFQHWQWSSVLHTSGKQPSLKGTGQVVWHSWLSLPTEAVAGGSRSNRQRDTITAQYLLPEEVTSLAIDRAGPSQFAHNKQKGITFCKFNHRHTCQMTVDKYPMKPII